MPIRVSGYEIMLCFRPDIVSYVYSRMPDPDGLDEEEEEEEEVQEGNLPSLDPTLDNQYYGFLNVPRFPLHDIIGKQRWQII